MAKFVDRVVVHATAGAGGNGCASVHREKFKPLGGPDGGIGGRGGSVVLIVDPGVHTLLDFHHRPHALARSGKQGQGGFKAGANAEDLELRVPDGTVVFDPAGAVVASSTSSRPRRSNTATRTYHELCKGRVAEYRGPALLLWM